MSAIPTISWVTRENRARLEALAESRGQSIERCAGDLLADALDRRKVAPVELPPTCQPDSVAHETARRRAQAESTLAAAGYDPKRWRDGIKP
ncbi:hypothetical protein AB4Y43_18305 [Paraburkholderia sp. BR10872]|uniref:hypothetical protein n=1 Tax=Paraburkholderia sp. BR10872 TaxID=3236989 RepID=UPI0034D25576